MMFESGVLNASCAISFLLEDFNIEVSLIKVNLNTLSYKKNNENKLQNLGNY